MLYLDDRLPTHPKILKAGALLGNGGASRALHLYVLGLTYARAHLTDGFIPFEFILSCGVVSKSSLCAQALASRHVGLWRKVYGGYQIHDYHDWNPKASTVKEKREADRARKAKARGRIHAVSSVDTARNPQGGASRARDRAFHESMKPVQRDGGTTSNQLEVVGSSEIRTTSKNLPPRFAQRCANPVENSNAKSPTGHRSAAALRSGTRAPDRRADDGRLRVEGTHQVPTRNPRLRQRPPACPEPSHDPGRAGSGTRVRASPAPAAPIATCARAGRHAPALGRRSQGGASDTPRTLRLVPAAAEADALGRVRADEHPRAVPHRGADRAPADDRRAQARQRPCAA